MNKLTWTRTALRKLTSRKEYEEAIKVYMAETSKAPPAFRGDVKRESGCLCGCGDPSRHLDGMGASGAPYFRSYRFWPSGL